VSDLKELIFQAVGQSSMCWDPIPTGVFDSTQAEKIGYEVFAKFEKLQRENQILREALKFYADYINYSVDYDTSQNGFSRRCVLYKDIEERNEATGLAGRTAREALKAADAVRGKE
jgi:hypothetical protein